MVEEVSRLLRPADKGHHTLSLLRLFERERQHRDRARGDWCVLYMALFKSTFKLSAVSLARCPWIQSAAPSHAPLLVPPASSASKVLLYCHLPAMFDLGSTKTLLDQRMAVIQGRHDREEFRIRREI